MKRRAVLRAASTTLAATALAGCVSDGSGTQGQGGSQTTRAGGQDADGQRQQTQSGGGSTGSETDSPTTTACGDTHTETDADTTASPTTTDGDEGRDEDTPTPTPEGAATGIADTSLTVQNNACGTTRSLASVSFGDDVVSVTGTISGSDTCRTATLADATLDADTGELRLTVGTENRCAENELGAACIVEIDYEASVTLEGGLPERVVVVHDGVGGRQEVATATPDGSA